MAFRSTAGEAPDSLLSAAWGGYERLSDFLPISDELEYDPKTGKVHSFDNFELNVPLSVAGIIPEYVENVSTANGSLTGFIYARRGFPEAIIITISPTKISVCDFDTKKNRVTGEPLFEQAVTPEQTLAVLQEAQRIVQDELKIPVQRAPAVDSKKTTRTSKERTRRAVVHALGTYDEAHETFVTSRRANIDLHIEGLPPCTVVNYKRPDQLARLTFKYSNKPAERLDVIYDPATGKIIRAEGPVTGDSLKDLLRNFVETVRASMSGTESVTKALEPVNDEPNGEPADIESNKVEQDRHVQAIIDVLNQSSASWAERQAALEALIPVVESDALATDIDRAALNIALELMDILSNKTEDLVDQINKLRDLRNRLHGNTTDVFAQLYKVTVQQLVVRRMQAKSRNISLPPDNQPVFSKPVDAPVPEAPPVAGESGETAADSYQNKILEILAPISADSSLTVNDKISTLESLAEEIKLDPAATEADKQAVQAAIDIYRVMADKNGDMIERINQLRAIRDQIVTMAGPVFADLNLKARQQTVVLRMQARNRGIEVPSVMPARVNAEKTPAVPEAIAAPSRSIDEALEVRSSDSDLSEPVVELSAYEQEIVAALGLPGRAAKTGLEKIAKKIKADTAATGAERKAINLAQELQKALSYTQMTPAEQLIPLRKVVRQLTGYQEPIFNALLAHANTRVAELEGKAQPAVASTEVAQAPEILPVKAVSTLTEVWQAHQAAPAELAAALSDLAAAREQDPAGMSVDEVFAIRVVSDLATQIASTTNNTPAEQREILEPLRAAVENHPEHFPAGLSDLILGTINERLDSLPVTPSVETVAAVVTPDVTVESAPVAPVDLWRLPDHLDFSNQDHDVEADRAHAAAVEEARRKRVETRELGGPFRATFDFQPDQNPHRGVLTWYTPNGPLRYTGLVNGKFQPDSAIPARLEFNDETWVGTFRDGMFLFGEQFYQDELVVSGYFEREPIVDDSGWYPPVPKPPSIFLGEDGFWYSVDATKDKKPTTLRRYQTAEDARLGRNVLLGQGGKNFKVDMIAHAIVAAPEVENQREFLAADFLSLLGPEKLHCLFTATQNDPAQLAELFHTIFDDLGRGNQTLTKLQTVGFEDRQAFIDWWRSGASETAATALRFFVLQGLERTAAAAQAKQTSEKKSIKDTVFGLFKKIAPGAAAGGAAGLAAGSAAVAAGQGPLATAMVAIFSAIQASRQVREHQAAPVPMAKTGRAERNDRWNLALDAQDRFYQENSNNSPELVAAIIAATVSGARNQDTRSFANHTRASEAQAMALRELATHTIRGGAGEFTPESSGQVADYLVAALDYRTDVLRNQLLDPVGAVSIGQKLTLTQELKQALGRGQIMNLWAGEKEVAKRWLGRLVETVAGMTTGWAMSTVGSMALAEKLVARQAMGTVTGSVRGYNQESARQTDVERAAQHKDLMIQLSFLRTEWRTTPNRGVMLDRLQSSEGQDMFNIFSTLKQWVNYATEHPEAQLFVGGELLFIQATELIREIETESKLKHFVERVDSLNRFTLQSPLEKAVSKQHGILRRVGQALKQGAIKGALYNVYGTALDGLRAIGSWFSKTETAVQANSTEYTKPHTLYEQETLQENAPLERRGEDSYLYGLGRRDIETNIETAHPTAPDNLPVVPIAEPGAEPVEPVAPVAEPAHIPEPQPILEPRPEFATPAFWTEFKTEHDLSDDTIARFQALHDAFKTSLDKTELEGMIETAAQGRGQGVESALLREFKVLHEALRDPANPDTITPDLQKLYDMVGYRPKSDQVPEWSQVKTAFAREAHRAAIRAGHITPDGLYQKVVMFKPGVAQRQVLGLVNGKFEPTYDQSPRVPNMQRDLDQPTPKSELRGNRSGAVERFVNDVTTGAYTRNIIVEPDLTNPQLAEQAVLTRVEPAGDHVIAHYADGVSASSDPVQDGYGLWHLFPHRANGEVELPTPAATMNVAEVIAQPTVRTAEVTLPGNVRATVAVGKNGLAELKLFGTMTLRADEARQQVLGDPHYPARLAPGNQAQFDRQANSIALGLKTYEALQASRQSNTAAAEALRTTLASAIRRMAQTAQTPVSDLVAADVARRLGIS